MSYHPDEIHLNSLDGRAPRSPQMQAAISELTALGFMFIDTYSVSEFPGIVLAGMVSNDGSIAAGVQQAQPEDPVYIEMTSYYPDGSSFTVSNLPQYEDLPQHPLHPSIPFLDADAQALLGMMFNARMSGPFLAVTSGNFQELGERQYRETTAFHKAALNMATEEGSDEEKLISVFNKVLSGEMDAAQFFLGGDVSMSDERLEEIVNQVMKKYPQEDGDLEEDEEDHPDEEMISMQSPGIDELEQALHSLDSWWADHDPELLEALNPGCSQEEIRAIEDLLEGYKLPLDIIALYRWHNGHDDLSLDIGTSRPFLSLQNAVAERNLMLEALGEEQWDPAWLPVYGEADEGLFVILSQVRKPHSGLYYYNLQSDPITMHYQSVLGKIRSLHEAFETGVLLPMRDQPDDYYEVYYSEGLESIREKHNPASYPFFRKRNQTYLMFGED